MSLMIGVMGSAADLKYSKKIEEIAEEIGKEIAKSENITVYGAEKDYDSLSTAAARGAKKEKGITIGVTYGKGKKIFDKQNTDICIVTGMERGGGREFVLVNSCDAIICVSGGSGTLTEIAIAYQSNIPTIVLQKTGGWSQKLENKYVDDRKRVKCIIAKNPKDAVRKAILEIKNKELNSNKGD
ncbi:MAG: LOG family protein [Candidatus ainarchaeum sp.]|nr:LOG family protein [Candidatus ainarchaeum sp.]